MRQRQTGDRDRVRETVNSMETGEKRHRQVMGGRRGETGDRIRETRDGTKSTGDRRQETGNGRQETGVRKLEKVL